MKVLVYALLFVLGLLIYALAYMLVPLMICKRKKPLSDWQIVKILLVNGPVAWVAISTLLADTKQTITAGVLMLIFSTADYFIMEKQSRLARANKPKYVPRYRNERTVQLEKIEVKPKEEKTEEKPGLSENRKQLVNFAMNVPEDKVDLALKLLQTITD